MMSSQLGRTILGGTASSADEMSAKPDQDGRYGPLDELLEKVVADARSGSEVGARDFLRFLLRWQHLEEPVLGEGGLLEVIEQLSGVEPPRVGR